MDKIILSICIPTYNRADYLKRCLQSISVQLANNDYLGGQVEIVISDNCSTDNTKQIIKEYEGIIPRLKYTVNAENIGFDLNVLNVVKNSNGRYCWYLGDDDVILNGGIEFVFSLLENSNYDIITLEQLPFLNKDNKDFKIRKTFLKDLVEEISDKNYFYFNNYCAGDFSIFIFEKKLWLSCVDENNFLKYWLYYETVLKILAKTNKKMLRIKQPLVLTGQDCRWAENGGELFTFTNSNILLDKIINLGFDKKRLTKNLITNSKKIIIILLRAKGHNLKCNVDNLKYMLANAKKTSYIRLVIATLIYFIPNKIIIFIRDTKKKFI